MTHIRLQDRQQRADVLALREPETQIVNREGVSQVVDTGTVARSAVRDAGLPEEPAEVPFDVPDRQRLAGPAGEEPVPGRPPDEACVVVGEPDPQRFGDGNLPVLTALGVADLQHSGVDVDIVRAQQTGLAQPQTAGVDRPEQHRHDQVPERHQGTGVAPVGLGEQRRQFLVGVDVRDVAGGSGQHPRGQHVGVDAAAAQPAGQFPDRRGQTLQGRRFDSSSPSGRDPRLDRNPGDRAQSGELGTTELLEPGQHPRLGHILVAHHPLLRDERCDRVRQRDIGGGHRDTCVAGWSGSSAHSASRPRDDFR